MLCSDANQYVIDSSAPGRQFLHPGGFSLSGLIKKQRIDRALQEVYSFMPDVDAMDIRCSVIRISVFDSV